MSTDVPSDVDRPIEHVVIAQLRAFVRRRIADPDRADDLVGEILLRIHQNLHTVDDRERLLHWVFRVARNAVIDEYRRAGRAREQPVAAVTDGPLTDQPPGSETGVLDELAACLRPLIPRLPAEHRRAVELIDLDGVSQADAARLEGISLSGMKSRVQRGRRRLAKLLEQCCALTLDARGVPMDFDAPAPCGCESPAARGC